MREAGRFYYNKGDARAAQTLLRALTLDPNDIMAQFFYARLLDGSGDKRSAHKYYREILRHLPQDSEVHYYYGRSLGEAGQVFDAYLHLAYSALYQNDKRKTESWLKQARPLAHTPDEQKTPQALRGHLRRTPGRLEIAASPLLGRPETAMTGTGRARQPG